MMMYSLYDYEDSCSGMYHTQKGNIGGRGGGGGKGVIPEKAVLLSRHALLACRDT